MNKQYKYNCKIQFEDCDMQGIVHHPRFFCYLERARIDALSSTDYNYKDLLNDNMGFVLTDIKTKFISPGYYNDDIVIVSKISGVYAHCIKMNQIILRNKDIQLPLDNWMSNENTIICSSIRFSIVNIKTNKPITNKDEIFKKMNITNKDDIKSVSFKHPFN